MDAITEWVRSVAPALGGPGLFLVAFLDSSFLSLPQINDLLIILAVVRQPARLPFYALMATAGSVAGCLVLYALAARGGDALLRSRFRSERIEKGTRVFQRYGVLAVLVPALLPPPAPFKLFVLLAGVTRVPLLKFVLAITLGRGVRYLGEGWLAVLYGRQAIAFLEEHSTSASVGLAVLAVVAGAAFVLWRRRQRRGTAGV